MFRLFDPSCLILVTNQMCLFADRRIVCACVFFLQYVSTLRSATKGRANYSMQLLKYDFVPQNVEKDVVAKYGTGKPVDEDD